MYRGLAFRLTAARKAYNCSTSIVRSFSSTPALFVEKVKEERVNKESIAKMIAETHKLSLKESSKILDNVFNAIVQSLQEHKAVHVPKFGKFQSVVKKATTSRNPKTGEPVEVPEKMRVKFTAFASLKDKVNGIEEAAAGEESTGKEKI